MNKKDPNYIAALEKAIKEKYGELATMNPKMYWDSEKEQQYILDCREANKKNAIDEQSREKVDLDGVLISKKLISKNSNKVCICCKEYSFNNRIIKYISGNYRFIEWVGYFCFIRRWRHIYRD